MINYAILFIALIIGMLPNRWILGRFIDRYDLYFVRCDEVGAEDMIANITKPPFFTMVLLDIFKGAGVVFLAQAIDGWTALPWAALLFVVVAHNFNFIAGLKNGTGVMMLLGGMLFLYPAIIALYVIFYLLLGVIIKDEDFKAVFATLSVPFGAIFIFDAVHTYVFGLIFVVMMIAYKAMYIKAMGIRSFNKEYKKTNPFY